MQIELQDAALRLADLIRAAQRGEAVVIHTPEGLVRLAPVTASALEPAAPTFGGARGSVIMRDDFDDPPTADRSARRNGAAP